VDLFQSGSDYFNQLHDFNPGIADSGLFWTVRVPDSALTIEGSIARLQVNASLVDTFTFLGPGPSNATVSFDVTWTSSGKMTHFTPGSLDPADPTSFAAEFRDATAVGSFSGSNELGFSFTASHASSEEVFARMGTERNGSFLQ